MKRPFLLLLLALATALDAVGASQMVTLSTGATLEIFQADAAKANGMAMIVCPGGGYAYLADANEGTDWADYLNNQGFTMAVLRYRLPKTNSGWPLADGRAALQYLRDHAASLNIQGDRVGVMGFSAGGHLASTIATHTEGDERPAFQILFYPVITMEAGKTHQGSIDELLGKNPSAKLVEEYSNQKHVTADAPVAYVTYSTNDGTVPPTTNGKVYYDALVAAGVPAVLKTYAVGGHGWGKLVGEKLGAAAQAEMQQHFAAWLAQLPTLLETFPEVTSYTVEAGADALPTLSYRAYPNLATIIVNSAAVAGKGYTSKSNLLTAFGPAPTEYIFGEGITAIGKYALTGAENLVRVQLPSTLETIGANSFSKCTSLSDVEIPASVTEIGISAFGFTALTHLSLQGVRDIKASAFTGCEQLQTVELSEAIDTISASAFKNCTSLMSMKCHSPQPPRAAATFLDAAQKAQMTLYVPVGSRAAYEASTAWSGFAAVEEFVASGIRERAQTTAAAPAYTLDGRPATAGQRGIVVTGGRKMLRTK